MAAAREGGGLDVGRAGGTELLRALDVWLAVRFDDILEGEANKCGADDRGIRMCCAPK